MEFKTPEINEIKKPEPEGFKEIKPENGMNSEKAKEFWNDKFENKEELAPEIEHKDISECVSDYIQDIRDKSDVPDTIPENPIDVKDLRKLSPEETAPLRKQFNDVDFKNDLKHQWEVDNNREWPKYKEDLYITNSRGEQVLIRKAGSDYDAHHIQPLSLGGKNEARNLTPLSADVHFDHRGVHEKGGPCDRLSSVVGGEK